jgi:cytochrome c oxidase accessory protein FixG
MEDDKKEDIRGSFRDSVATISAEGSRNFIFPKKPKGRLYNVRTVFSVFYLVIFFTLPFIKINDEPIFMFNVLERKFIFFSVVFWPQDFFIFGIAMITFIVFVILFTVVFGRIFCGWACPQTIFMEMVFRKIEYWIEGDASQQKILKQKSWTSEKIFKRSLKFVIFFSISFIIANFFLAYLISMDKLIGYIENPAEHTGTLISLLIFTTIFFFVYWWFREQVCIVVCPYGRLQGVLLDKNSIVVAYDHVRGEERAKLKAAEQISNAGDCIDCFACVKVCPTAIDIRNGTQLECINCTACIDACDDIMEHIKKPKGLIRYASENSIINNVKLKFNNRIKAYTVVLSLLLAFLCFLIVTRTDLDVRLMRTSGMAFTTMPNGDISNLYNLKLVNKTHKDISYELRLDNLPGEIKLVGSNSTIIKKEDYSNIQFFVILNKALIKNWKTKIIICLYQNGKKLKTVDANFIGPEIYN